MIYLTEERTKMKLIEIAPDGPQGGKLRLGVTENAQITALREWMEKNQIPVSINNVRLAAERMGIPLMDTV